MSETIKQQVQKLGHDAESIFSRMKEIKEKVASVNRAIESNEALKADSELLDKMVNLCDELGLGPDAKIREIQPADCSWCKASGGA